jgi:Predicted transcriptional regulator with C-terminal CBS domains
MKNNIGANIAKYRKLNGISQKYLAEKLSISTQGLLKIEKGQTSPRAATLEKVIFILGITPNQLFGIEEITEENSSLLKRVKEA